MRQIKEQAGYQFAASGKDGPAWGFGKFACPGRFWAGAQIKLVIMALLLHYGCIMVLDILKNRPTGWTILC